MPQRAVLLAAGLIAAQVAAGLIAAQPAAGQQAAPAGSVVPPALAEILAGDAAHCAQFGYGEMQVAPDAIVRADLDGDGAEDWVLDEWHVSCAAGPVPNCGANTCNITFLVGDVLTTRSSKGWEAVDFPPMRVVLVQVHGSQCGGINLNPCVEAMVWDPSEKRFFSLAPEG